MRLRITFAAAVLLGATALVAENPPPVLKMPGAADRPIPPASLLGKASRDVRLEDTSGDVTVYHGLPLLEVLESNGLDLKTMASERQTAASVVLVSGREGYTVAFSVGELKIDRANPKVFLVAETSARPAPREPGAGPSDRLRRPGSVGLRTRTDRAEDARGERPSGEEVTAAPRRPEGSRPALATHVFRRTQRTATSFSKRGFPRSGSKLGSILSQPGERM